MEGMVGRIQRMKRSRPKSGMKPVPPLVSPCEAGKYTAIFEGWVRDVGSVPTSRKIED